ncbi:Glutathione synthetase [hydrothermal vent metagenome]|uniref:Glutathione synthetase n=1 Tax=hydrothermal vent metagenome TaxID=652676 RepID=A0A3B1AQF5_9ZZZZ
MKLAVIMDPVESINYKKDSTLAMLLEAQQRGYQLFYMPVTDLYLRDAEARARVQPIQVKADPEHWFELSAQQDIALSELDVILMRKDPPFDMNYIYATYLLEAAEQTGVLVVNRARSLRDANEKLFALQFPQCTPECLVASSADTLKNFIREQQDVILKPLDGMGGQSIFRVRHDDPNLNVIIETLTEHGQRLIMAQRYLPEIVDGDKRILLIDGEAIPYALARLPGKGETRANLAVGGTAQGQTLSEKDLWICQQLGPRLKEMGLIFVGIDVIGDYLTEVNVTSPTCIRELDTQFDLNISALLMDKIEEKVKA